MPTGPRGEKRPVSSVSSMVKAMKVATGIEAEEYADGKPKARRDKASFPDDDEQEDDAFQIAAFGIAPPKTKTKKRKKSKNKPVK